MIAALPLLTALSGCAPPKNAPDDTGAVIDTDGAEDTDTGDPDTDTQGETGSDTGGDTVDTADSGDTAVGDQGLVSWVGDASVADGWVGGEAVMFVGNLGLGDTLCEVWYPVEDVARRDDCSDCETAWDVRFGAPEVRVDTWCEHAGYDGATIAAREGEVRGYGFALNYLGHSNVLMYDDEGTWKAVAFVDWDQGGQYLTYSWEQEYLDY